MQTEASPLQEQGKIQTAAVEEELATLRDQAQSELLKERAGQISDLKEDRDRWRQQAGNLLIDRNHLPDQETKNRKHKWWIF